MLNPIKISGLLYTCKLITPPGEPEEYIVKLGKMLADEYIGNLIPSGGAVRFVVKRPDGYVILNFNGKLDVSQIKQTEEYFENNWKVAMESPIVSFRVKLGGVPISTRIAGLYKHSALRTYFNRGWHSLLLYPIN